MQKPWKVVIHAPSAWRAASRSPSSSSRPRTRARSSPAAFSVKVIARTWSARRPSSTTEATKRSTSTDVLPDPALADSMRSPSRRATASACSAVTRRHADAASQRQIVGCAHPPRYAHDVGSGTSAPERMPRTAASAASSTSSRSASNSPGARRSRSTLASPGSASSSSRPARAAVVVAAQRLVEPADRLHAEQLRQGEQVEPDLQARLVEPLGLRRGALALVVVDDRLAAVGADVDAIDATLQPQLAARQLGRAERVLGTAEAQLELPGREGRAPVGGVLDVAQQVDLQPAQGRRGGARRWARCARRRRARRGRRAAARGPRRGARG